MKIIDDTTNETLNRITNENILSMLELSDVSLDITRDRHDIYSDGALEDLSVVLDKIITKLVRI